MDNTTGPAFDAVAESLETASEMGLYCAYAALLTMALIPIWVGSHRSLAPKTEVSRQGSFSFVHYCGICRNLLDVDDDLDAPFIAYAILDRRSRTKR
jgi:hypothetical protein